MKPDFTLLYEVIRQDVDNRGRRFEPCDYNLKITHSDGSVIVIPENSVYTMLEAFHIHRRKLQLEDQDNVN